MKIIQRIHWVYFSASLLGVLAIDLTTKWMAFNGVIGDSQIIRGFFYLTAFQTNDGIAFGIPLPMPIQIMGSALILLLLVRVGFNYVTCERRPSIFRLMLLGAVAGGGLGNLLDRITNGYVIDFIVLRPLPTFNVADVGITVGIVLLFGTMMLFKKRCEDNDKTLNTKK